MNLQILKKESEFETGKLLQTSGINTCTDVVNFNTWVWQCMARHKSCDWGDLTEADKKNNDAALEIGERLFSSYDIPDALKQFTKEEKIWIITERNRSYTTILFPSEY